MVERSLVAFEMQGDCALITIDNPPINATSTQVRRGLLDAILRTKDARLAMLACAGRSFVAGGDITEFDAPPEPPHLPDIVEAIEASPTPFVALLHGTVLGGGFELAMACAWRVAHSATRFGLPEVRLGLIPGAGGTQRAPRLLGWQNAVLLACEGKWLGAETLLECGGIDRISDDVEAAARGFLGTPPPISVSKRKTPPLDEEWLEEMREKLAKKAKGQLSPLQNLEALSWAQNPYIVSQPKERAWHLQLRQSPQSKALRHIFMAERKAANPTFLKGQETKNLQKIAVIGGGLMGAGIAVACLLAGKQVRLIEQSAEAAKAAEARVFALLGEAVERGKISTAEAAPLKQNWRVAHDYSAAAEAELVIEAVFEDINTKKAVFNALASHVSDTAILATNTSYLDPRVIFDGINGQQRCLGLHFFAPAHIMTLVEIITLPETSLATQANGLQFIKQLKKNPVFSGICDGFIGNRILAAYRRAAEYLLADGALPEQIDEAMRGFGMAMGPFEAQDMSGLQIAFANRRRQAPSRPAAERYVAIADRLCEAGRLGQRVGKGWYLYESGSRKPKADPKIAAMIIDYSKEHGLTRREFSTAQIQSYLLAVMANEGARIIEAGIAADAASVDLVKINGYGYPRWRGGPMFDANALGASSIRATLDELDALSPNSWLRAKQFY